jgi:hypothetical protein
MPEAQFGSAVQLRAGWLPPEALVLRREGEAQFESAVQLQAEWAPPEESAALERARPSAAAAVQARRWAEPAASAEQGAALPPEEPAA